jgi:hypothetical protein
VAVLPQRLEERLGAEGFAELSDVVDAIGEELALVYEQTVEDQREARGDNSQVFGLRIWTRGEFRIEGRFEGSTQAKVLKYKGSYKVVAGTISIGIYKVGHSVDDDVHASFPDESPTKREYADANRRQLTIFDCEVDSPLPPAVRYALDELVVAHFGNPRDGLVKWYVGAMITDDQEQHSWAWVEKQDLPGESKQPAPLRPSLAPFDSRQTPPLRVTPRQRPTGS